MDQLILKKNNFNKFEIFINNGRDKIELSLNKIFDAISIEDIGEFYINSIDKDGTGQDYNYNILEQLPKINIPIIFAGGAGNPTHIINCLKNSKVDAASTAHLFNFIGNSLENTRKKAITEGIELATWGNF